ncbi:MAG TPA: hypothetical protein VMT87_07560 [Vicinamibacteria bacterium]|nr:hypothetical protein [Vicinamibacteria bacterium]
MANYELLLRLPDESGSTSTSPASRVLRDIGVDCAQGYHVGRPRPVAELLH